MRCFIIMTLVLGLVISALAQSEPPAASEPASDSLSNLVTGVDTLGIMPNALETPYQGGLRRIPLENSVFRRETPIAYSAGSHRDPFRALLVERSGEGDPVTDLLLVDQANLTGVVWAGGQSLATVKDKRGRSFFLRQGDPVYRGRVVAITQTSITFEISGFGEYRQVTLRVND